MGCTSSAPGQLTPSAYRKAAAVSEACGNDGSLQAPDALTDTKETLEIKRCDSFLNTVAAVDSHPTNTPTEQSLEDRLKEAMTPPEEATITKAPANPDDLFNEAVPPPAPLDPPAAPPDPPGALGTLEDVVERVVELYITEAAGAAGAAGAGQADDAAETRAEMEEHDGDDGDSTGGSPAAGSPAAGSPARSCSSRATRWEALADVAAELPPALAVDPLTGQIYSK